jgi:hypothetical protein
MRPTVERAYELARSGQCDSVQAIRKRLKEEHYDAVDAQLAGPAIQRDLRALCAAALVASKT